MCCLAVFQVFWCILGMASGTVKKVYVSSRDRTYPLDMWFSLAEAWWRRSRTSSLKDTLTTHLHQKTHLTTDDLIMRCVYCTHACLYAALFLFPLLLSSHAVHQHQLCLGWNQLFRRDFNPNNLCSIHLSYVIYSAHPLCFSGLYVNYTWE